MEVNLDDINTVIDEHVAVTLRLSGRDVTIISSYVRPGQPWDAASIRLIRARCRGPLVWCGDFNGNHPAWGSDVTTSRGTALLDVMRDLDLKCLNSGTPTFIRAHLRNASLLDLTFASQDIQMVWDIEPSSWGSDHLPIRLTPQKSIPIKKNIHKVINWDLYRSCLSKLMSVPPIPEIEGAISTTLNAATKTITLPVTKPIPDLTYLNLRAAARRAQRVARRTDEAEDWTISRRIEAVLRRHTVRLGRTQMASTE